MKKNILCFMVSLALLTVIIPTPELLSVPYYEGKRIAIIVGSEPGGSSDRMARLLATHLPNYIPGKPTVIVQNMPDAGSLSAANYLYNMAKSDGLTVLNFQKSPVFSQLLKVQGVKFDLTKFSWLGSQSIESTVFVVRNVRSLP